MGDERPWKRPPILENDRILVPRPLIILGKRLRKRSQNDGL